jgi:AraC family transcriptional regulator, melibiose operon regulatory protein
MVSFDPNRPDFAPYGLTCVRWSPSPMRRPDHHNEIELNLLHAGWVTYLLGGRKVTIVPGRLSVFWAAIPHQIIDYGDEPDYFVATIPFAWFLQCKLPDRFAQPLLHGEVVSEPDATRAPCDYQLFENWVSDLKAAGDDLKHVVLLEMHARLLRLALELPATRPQSTPLGRRKAPLELGGLNKVEQMACLIAQRYLEHLSVDEIGRAVGLHPNYAMGLFKRTFGTTLVDYLTHHRVSHAQRLLATTDRKIVEVALESGFNSISRFNEAFRRACGCSPREYRQRHRLPE